MNRSEYEYQMCLRKVRYTSKKRALNMLKQIGKKKIIPSNAHAYKCPVCDGGWHLGHDKKKV